jgi:hypothetical protein
VYAPAATFEIVAPFIPLLQEYVLLPVPPVAEAVMLPLFPPLQLTFVTVPETARADGALTVVLAVFTQP